MKTNTKITHQKKHIKIVGSTLQFSYWCNFNNVTYSSFHLSPKLCELYVPKWGDLPKGTQILLCIFILQTWLNLCLQNYIIIIIIYCTCTYMSILWEIHRCYASFGPNCMIPCIIYLKILILSIHPKDFCEKAPQEMVESVLWRKTQEIIILNWVFDANYCSINRINT